MPVTMSIVGGDGINAPAIRMNISLPDSGTSVPVQGVYVAPLNAATPAAAAPKSWLASN